MPHRRRFVTSARIGLVTASLLLSAVQAATPDRTPASLPTNEAAVVHVLNRLGFGPAPGDVARVKAMGLEAYIDTQLHPERLSDAAVRLRLAGFETLSLDTATIAKRYYAPALQARREIQRRAGTEATAPGGAMEEREPAMSDPAASPEAAPTARFAQLAPEARARIRELRREEQKVLGELGQQKLLRAVYSERQLEEVLVDFWFNHFNVFAGKGPVRVYLTEYERDAIRPHVLGRFRDLLGATAKSPAMLFYLDNWQSADPDLAARLDRMTGRARQPRTGASAARLEQLRQRMPRGLNENYARELLELHTLGVDGGYTQQDVIEVAKAFTGWTIRTPRQGGGYWFDGRRHVNGPKTVLETRIDAGGERDGEAVLDLLAAHPATATFVATKLARRFVADDPPVALVARAAQVFRTTGGDLRAVTRAIVTAPELFSTEARRVKIKTPFEFVASTLRASGAEVRSGLALLRTLRELGMPLYFAQPPTGYADKAEAWVNTGALVNRMNVAVSLVNNRVPGVRVDLAPLAGEGGLAAAKAHLVDVLLLGAVTDATRQTVGRGTVVTEVAALVIGSPEFQRK